MSTPPLCARSCASWPTVRSTGLSRRGLSGWWESAIRLVPWSSSWQAGTVHSIPLVSSAGEGTGFRSTSARMPLSSAAGGSTPTPSSPRGAQRHSDPLVDLPRGSSALLNPNGIPDDAHAALVEARSRLLAVVGLASIIPGSAAHVTAEVDVPVFSRRQQPRRCPPTASRAGGVSELPGYDGVRAR